MVKGGTSCFNLGYYIAIITWQSPLRHRQGNRKIPCYYQLPSIAAFFKLFAATESCAIVCIAHGTLCSDPSVYPTLYNGIELRLQISSHAMSVCFDGTPGRKTLI